MICSKCGKEAGAGRFCQHCGGAVGSPAPTGGLATLRIIARKRFFIWRYKVYISVDDQEYVLKSKNQQIDIPVVPGVRFVRISSISKKQAKGMKIGGMVLSFFGAVNGSSSTYVAGNMWENAGAALSKDGVNLEFKPGQIEEIRVKMNFMSQIVEDTGK